MSCSLVSTIVKLSEYQIVNLTMLDNAGDFAVGIKIWTRSSFDRIIWFFMLSHYLLLLRYLDFQTRPLSKR